ncbi:MAG: PssE/Cps14G family polysaccharide biosynthesis glycosyltransferase [Candidatus Thorarchaeota archaeon]|jgi:beta-1,4-N-acetylglucosaminyltransferase
MIFVTVGTAHFDPLIEKMDQLVESGKIGESIVAQIGRGSYTPRNFRFFRFMRSLKPAYDKANVIISTGGAGTIIECVKRGLRLVVVENTTLMEGHQAQLIGEMSRRGYLIWCKDLDTLNVSIKEAMSRDFEPFIPEPALVPDMIRKMLE